MNPPVHNLQRQAFDELSPRIFCKNPCLDLHSGDVEAHAGITGRKLWEWIDMMRITRITAANVHPNTSVEKICDLDADVAKNTVAFGGIATGSTNAKEHWQVAGTSVQVWGCDRIRHRQGSSIRGSLDWHDETHVALFPWTVKAMTIEREREAKSPTPSKGCDSWRSFPPSRTPTVLACLMPRLPCTSLPWRLDTNTNIPHELHSHTNVRNRLLADEINTPQQATAPE